MFGNPFSEMRQVFFLQFGIFSKLVRHVKKLHVVCRRLHTFRNKTYSFQCTFFVLYTRHALSGTRPNNMNNYCLQFLHKNNRRNTLEHSTRYNRIIIIHLTIIVTRACKDNIQGTHEYREIFNNIILSFEARKTIIYIYVVILQVPLCA